MVAFKVGDLVQLKSGGPVMTVIALPGSHASVHAFYKCSWFAGKRHASGYFPPEALQPAKEEAPGKP